MKSLLIAMPNPLFEREWRGRFRRFNSFAQIALLVVLVAASLWLATRFFEPNAASVEQIRATGFRFLQFYRAVGGALIFALALLFGASTIVGEKTAGTFEQILLCPLKASEILRGKIASAAAFTLVLQIALWPLVLTLGATFLIPLAPLAGVVFAHFLLTLLGLALGILGATKRDSVQGALATALGSAFRAIVMCFASVVTLRILALFVYLFVALALILLRQISVLKSIFGVIQWLPNYWREFAQWVEITEKITIIPFFAGVCGLGLARETSVFGVAGSLVGCALILRLCVWQLRYPDRNFVASRNIQTLSNADLSLNSFEIGRLRLWIRVWREELSQKELALFEIASQSAPPKNFAFPNLDSSTKTAKNRSGKRLRLFSGRRFQNLNPVFALDLARCLSLRSPDPKAQLPLLLFAAIGGSLAFAVGLFTLVSLIQSVFTGSRGDLSSLDAGFRVLELTLCFGALICGPIFGALGFVVERRSQMLHELRLTLLSARAMLWGKFGARFLIPVVAAIPGWFLLAFWDSNRAQNGFLTVWSGQIALVCAIAAFSTSLCLNVSFLAKNEVMAALWCGAATLAVAALWKWTPLAISPFVALETSKQTFVCAALHGILATLGGAHLLWRLKRLGFG